MRSKAAIQTSVNHPLILDELEIPEPQPDQVVLKMLSSGICHSQIHNMQSSRTERPMVLGHEGVGIVTKIGSQVTHLKEGDHAIVTWVPRIPVQGRPEPIPCGATYKNTLVHGIVYTWAEDTLAHGKYVIPISNAYPTDITCIVGCAILTGAGAVLNTAKVRPGDSVAIYGVGGVGLSAIKMASLLEAYPIIAVDIKDEKLEFAKDFGATHTINASNNDPIEEIIEISKGGVDYAFDAIGLKLTNEQILPSTRGGGPGADNHGGVAILIGMPGTEMTVDPGMFMFHQRQYRGSLGATYPEKDFPMFLKWYQEGKFPLEQLVTRRYKLDDINKACDDLVSGEILGRAIIEY